MWYLPNLACVLGLLMNRSTQFQVVSVGVIGKRVIVLWGTGLENQRQSLFVFRFEHCQ